MDMFRVRLEDFFDELIEPITTSHKETKAYINSTFVKFLNCDLRLVKSSLAIEYYRAKTASNFKGYQDIADWIFFIKSLFPEHLSHASAGFYDNLARASYYKCYRLLGNQWPLFEELADRFLYLTKEIRTNILIIQKDHT